jgi:hypothetical protein
VLSGTNTFTVPRPMSLQFYSEDTKSVIDPDFSKFYTTPAVLTLRNRWFKGEAALSLAIAAALKVAPGITVVECPFCRSTMFGGSQSVQFK